MRLGLERIYFRRFKNSVFEIRTVDVLPSILYPALDPGFEQLQNRLAGCKHHFVGFQPRIMYIVELCNTYVILMRRLV